MNSDNVTQLVRPFDPVSAEAEEHYDAVVRRINRVRARRHRIQKESDELQRQFIEGDLRVSRGARSGEPLTAGGRRRRMTRMLELNAEVRRLDDEERFAADALDRMNHALDRWARETYGP